MANYSDLYQKILACLRRYEREGAIWTSDVSHECKAPTAAVLSRLKVLAHQGKVLRVIEGGKGHPSSWMISPSARA